MHLRAHRDVDVLIAESRATYECYRQNGFPAEQIALLPNMTQVLGSWEEIVRFNERYHDPTRRTVLYVGRASSEKGIDHLVEANRTARIADLVLGGVGATEDHVVTY